MNNQKDSKVIRSCGIARSLLKANCEIIDIKPDRDNATTGKEKTVFVFKYDEHFKNEFERINNEISTNKNKVND